MHNVTAEIKSFLNSRMGNDFHLEILPFQNKSRDPFEQKTKNRLSLRTALYQYLKNSKNFVFEDVLDLRNVPQKIDVSGKDYYSSLSHTDDKGVFVMHSAPVGVDFENRDRIKKEVIARVCKNSELGLTINFQLLWSIKEASFKSIPFIIQPKAISDLIVTEIIPVTDFKAATFSIFRFAVALNKSPSTYISGFTFSDEHTQLAVAVTSLKPKNK